MEVFATKINNKVKQRKLPPSFRILSLQHQLNRMLKMKKCVELKDAGTLANIIKHCQEYYKQHNPVLTKEHYSFFINSLPENIQKYFIGKGYRKTCKNSLFKRFVLETSGYSMEQYLAERLSSDEFRLWQAQDQHFQELLVAVR